MTSFLWYGMSILFGFVGHAIVSNSLVYENPTTVKNSLKLAIISSCIWAFLFAYYVSLFIGSD